MSGVSDEGGIDYQSIVSLPFRTGATAGLSSSARWRCSDRRVWLGSTNGSPQLERRMPERVTASFKSYARLARGFA